MPRKTNLRTRFASLAVNDLSIPGDLSPAATAGLEFALALHDQAPAEYKDAAAHFFFVLRKVAIKDAREGNEKAAWAWGWKGLTVVNTRSGEQVAAFPAGREQKYCRPGSVLALMDEHGEDLVCILDEQAAVPA